jgi:NitT/TauT family transport system permease protein
MIKNNYSPSHQAYLRSYKRKKMLIFALQISLLISILILWEVLTHYHIIDSFIFSSPSRILKTIGNLYASNELFLHIKVTLLEVIFGFFLSTFLGVFIAIVLWWSDAIKRVIDPYLVVLNSLPKVALGPIIIIWFGANQSAIIVMAILITVIITILNMLNAFLAVDNDKILLLKSMGATKGQILFKLVLPHSLPKLINTLKINVGLTWVGVIMGEHLVSKAGLGYQILYGQQTFKMDLIMTNTVILCTLASVMYFIVSVVEKKLIKHH